MNDKERFKIMKAGIEMYESLVWSMRDAGGMGFSIEDLEKLSATELIGHLATNGIRFTFRGNDRISRATKYIQSIINEVTSTQPPGTITQEDLLNIREILTGLHDV